MTDKERINRFEEKVSRLSNVAWVIGTVAIIFGIGGGFGLDSFLSVKKK